MEKMEKKNIGLSITFMFIVAYLVAQSPGGTSANLKLWLKANDGLSQSSNIVTSWVDKTGVNTFSTVGSPGYIDNGLNYNPVVSFNGSSRFEGNTTITNSTEAFAVAKIVNTTGINTSGAVLGNTSTSSTNYFFHTQNGSFYCSGGNNYLGTSSFGNNVPFGIFNADLSESPAANNKLKVNGLAYTNILGGDPSPYSRIPTIGSRAAEFFLDGCQIAEVVLYDASKSSGRHLINSYLAIKYGFTLSNSGGGIAGDYTLSNTTSLAWDASDGTGYHRDVVGIAKDNGSALLQKQSKTASDSFQIFVGSLAATNADNTGTITNDLSSILVGHNYGKQQSLNSSEKPSGIYSRFDREWKITNTNFSDNFSIRITWDSVGTFNLSDLRLLVDDDGNFSNATIIGSPTVTFSVGSIIISGISTSVIPMNSTRYITVASVSASTPLPIELTDFNTINCNNRVCVDWHTNTEKNNDFFSLERSANGFEWLELAKIKGAGTTNKPNNYYFEDVNPLGGTSYYRLTQTDFDGTQTQFEAKSVKLINDRLSLSPNPSLGYIELSGNVQNLESFKIYNMMGQDVSGVVVSQYKNLDTLKIDVTRLPNGYYWIKFNEQVISVILNNR